MMIEFCNGGTLYDQMKEKERRFSEGEVVDIVKQVIFGVAVHPSNLGNAQKQHPPSGPQAREHHVPQRGLEDRGLGLLQGVAHR